MKAQFKKWDVNCKSEKPAEAGFFVRLTIFQSVVVWIYRNQKGGYYGEKRKAVDGQIGGNAGSKFGCE